METITQKPYAAFLESSLLHMLSLPISGLCILMKLDDGTVCSNYYNSNTMDKMLYTGVIQQDITWEMLKINNAGNTQE